MGRMHSGGKGKSGSRRPNISEVPEWSEQDKEKVEAQILQLHEEGNSSAVIGTILRDQYAVPNVQLLLGKKVMEVLRENDKAPEVPEEVMNLLRRAVSLVDHLDNNRKDLHNQRQLELVESKIRRIARYHRGEGNLPSDWNYKRDQLRLMVE
uniref:Small ribosomal subunit protein uS15 n=1 Tax=uncultured marine group II/III euryarchaeote KM3_99_A09 TaxID=1456549 RepID=A0A075I0G1_9EURY|nr:ribosomal protein S15P (RP-S15, rpsO) [uncultured marine group II/III euryarchaeote KM3_99_A09]